jgi:hypothetical protein
MASVFPPISPSLFSRHNLRALTLATAALISGAFWIAVLLLIARFVLKIV